MEDKNDFAKGCIVGIGGFALLGIILNAVFPELMNAPINLLLIFWVITGIIYLITKRKRLCIGIITVPSFLVGSFYFLFYVVCGGFIN